ncbi:hypothetical protein KY325_01790 [Candidatus Woesearchaeota archaeon]|nr:hypothetical protein [Candidatus Woesearchaeota archaeon]MBW3017870.1 hypothetical protein [Candidatus Woesearchaeota archaeon]
MGNVRCKECGCSFAEDPRFVGGSLWCESCRSKHSDKLTEARRLASKEFGTLYEKGSVQAEEEASKLIDRIERNRGGETKHVIECQRCGVYLTDWVYSRDGYHPPQYCSDCESTVTYEAKERIREREEQRREAQRRLRDIEDRFSD